MSSVSQSNDARMTRWPFSFTAHPLLHQVWGLNPGDIVSQADFTLEVVLERHHFDPPHRIEPARVAASLHSLWDRAEKNAI